MTTALLLTYVLLWALVLMLTVAVFLLYRQHGQSLLREASHGQGPPVDGLAPPELLSALARVDESQGIGETPEYSLVVFASERCRACREILSELVRVARDQSRQLRVYVVCRSEGEGGSVDGVCSDIPLPVAAIADTNSSLAMQLHIIAMPFGLVIDGDGIVRLKAVVSSEKLRTFEQFITGGAQAPGEPHQDRSAYAS